jgi:hypothetical protein
MRYNKNLKYRPTGNGNGQFRLSTTINTQTPYETLLLLTRLGFNECNLGRNFSSCLGKGEAPFDPMLPLSNQTNQNPDMTNRIR